MEYGEQKIWLAGAVVAILLMLGFIISTDYAKDKPRCDWCYKIMWSDETQVHDLWVHDKDYYMVDDWAGLFFNDVPQLLTKYGYAVKTFSQERRSFNYLMLAGRYEDAKKVARAYQAIRTYRKEKKEPTKDIFEMLSKI